MSEESRKEITDQQKAFCELYFAHNNKTKAYMEAFRIDEARYMSAAASANRLLKKPQVAAYYQSLVDQPRGDRIAKAEEVLEYFTKVMRGEEKDQFGLEVSISDRNKAAEALGKKYGLFTEKLEVKGNIDIASALKKARQRALERSDDS